MNNTSCQILRIDLTFIRHTEENKRKMACNSCGTKFNFFHKEMGCANCGMSFCSKCLKQKCKIPNKGNIEQNVCKICYTKFAAGSSNAEGTNIPPPDAYIKMHVPRNIFFITESPVMITHSYDFEILLRRLESLENPSTPPITIYQKNTKLQKLRSGLSPADLHILDRLEKLREDKNKVPLPTDSEIRMRLANLKGENPYVEGPTKMQLPDNRTDQQKADLLLEQFMNEREIELAHNPQEGIEARLASLREQGIRPNEGAYISNLHDSSSSEEEMDKVTRKIMDEVALEDKLPKGAQPDNSDEMDTSESPELPWCVLCNKDGTVRCLDCSGDIYCNKCNQEVHRQFGENDHKIIPFRPKNI